MSLCLGVSLLSPFLKAFMDFHQLFPQEILLKLLLVSFIALMKIQLIEYYIAKIEIPL